MIDFMIIGTQRGGTSSFYDYLLQHPRIVSAVTPSLNFFDQQFIKGVEWYQRQFPLLSEYAPDQRPSGHITGETSPYYLHHPLVPERIKRHCPHAKFIVLLRNPTDRAYSHFRYATEKGHENLAFGLALRMEAKRLERGRFHMQDNPYHVSQSSLFFSYISHGLYARQLSHWFRFFRKDQFLILKSEDYFANPLPEVIKAFAFLGLSGFEPRLMDPPHVNPYEVLTPETRKKIDRVFEKSNEDLCRLLGWKQAW